MAAFLIPIASLAQFFLETAIDDAKNILEKDAKKKVLQAQFPAIRDLLSEQIAQSYSSYVKDLSIGYVQAIADSSIEVSADTEEDQKLVKIAKNALRELEIFLEEQDQDGPVISYLKRRYEQEGVNKVTGRLFAGHYISRQSDGVYQIYNRMSYAPLVDKNKPWLSSDTTAQGIGDLIAEKADEIFQQAFDVDLSDIEV